MRIAVTGGAGYIGSHTVLLLLEGGHDVLIIDNFANSDEGVLERIASISGQSVRVARCDITCASQLGLAFKDFRPEAVIHFAGLKSVAHSVEDPLEYYKVNVAGSISLFQQMAIVGCQRLVFSSSATVYGDPLEVPIPESHPRSPTNPYGQSKLMVEKTLEDWVATESSLSIAILRYFNPMGAHSSGQIGEKPEGVPSNLMPFLVDVAEGRRKQLSIYGNDYETPDGTGLRDFIHVMDLARAHLAALDLTDKRSGVQSINIGTGKCHSVLDVVSTFEQVTGVRVPYVIEGRRAGDVAISVADPKKARTLMNWQAELDLAAMCRDAWFWRKNRF